jgi:tetratricopeptide (TPR) repeat protein
MKIAVYTIAKNEEKFVERWAKSSEAANYRLILDTGSTDSTVELARSFGIDVRSAKIDPWRFDNARNLALDLLPADIDLCVSLDMDEVLVDGWFEILSKIDLLITRPRYKYIWSWNKNGSEGLIYGGDKIHSRYGYVWKHPVHESLYPVFIAEKQAWIEGLEIHHYPDSEKSRSQYFDLLKLAVEEDPKNDRNQFYLAREYFYKNDIQMAFNHFEQFFELSNWAPERAAAYRMMYKMSRNEEFLYRALKEDPTRKETLVELANYYYLKNNWPPCKLFAEAAISIKGKPLDYLCEADAWSFAAYDYAAIACFNMGLKTEAVNYGYKALQLDPNNARLSENLHWYTKTTNK